MLTIHRRESILERQQTGQPSVDEKLRESEQLFQLLVESVEEYAIFMLDPQGRVASWNAGARRIKGYEPEEIIGRHFSVFYPEEDIRAGKPEQHLALARQHGSHEDEGWRVRKDVTRFCANAVITAVHDSDGNLRGFAKVTRDITEKRQAEETQRALLEQREARLQAEDERQRAESSYRAAQEANRAKDEFLMTLSHEMRTPMTAILGWARLLPSMSPQDPMFREAIGSIGRSAQLQARLIDDVLDVSRIVSGKLRLARETIDVSRVLDAAIDAVRPSADAKRITISTSLAPGLGAILADAGRLQQVMWNLLSNAMKFTPKDGTVQLSARRTSSKVLITVTDSGEGIEPQFLPHVFEPFRQAENSSTRLHSGLGLGLSIVHYIIEAHGGTVTADSLGRGQGATFTVALPIGALSSGTINAGAHPQQDDSRMRGILSDVAIIVVDDDVEARELIRMVLQQAGAEITAVESATLALAEMERETPNVVVTDIAMPAFDGYAFARELRQRRPFENVKIIALTAFPASTRRDEQTIFDAYLVKPVDPIDLVEAVVRVVHPGDKGSRLTS